MSRFCRFFCLTLPKSFVEEPFCVSECFGYRKTLCLRAEYYDFVSKNCCLTVLKKLVGEPFCLSQSGLQKFHGKEGGGSITFSVKIFWSKSRKNSCGNALVCHCFRVSKKFMPKRFMSRFFVELSVSHSNKKPPRGTLVFQKCYGVDFFWIIGVSRFCQFFCLTLPKSFVEEPFCLSQSGVQKVSGKEGGREHHNFLSKISGLSAKKYRIGTLYCVTVFGYQKIYA